MKKLIACFLLLLMMITSSVAVYADDANTSEKEWDMSVPTEITEEIQVLFDKAMEGFVGVDYTPLAVLGEKDDTFCILCKATAVYPGAKPYNALVYVSEDGIQNIYELWIEQHAEKETAEKEEETVAAIISSDYADPTNWLAIPEVTKEVDTFYIYPTAYMDSAEGAPDVCDIDSEILRTGAADVYEQQATAYEATTNVFAPFYRQVNMVVAASATAEERDELLQKEPKADLYAALDYYFENLNDGRPFILAGHSQGSQMMTYVLSEYMGKHPEYYERMVAAYALGYSITDKFLEENPHLKFAEGEDDLGVIISWNTEGEGNANAENFVVEEGAIAINPLNWKRDETYAGKELCLGARIQDAETGEFEVIPEAADAQLNTKRGVVVTHTDVLEPMDPVMGFGPESYHGGDYTLWYTNIQENVQSRVDRYVSELDTGDR